MRETRQVETGWRSDPSSAGRRAPHDSGRAGARRLREALLKVHRYVALSVGAMIVALSLSGSLLVLRGEFTGELLGRPDAPDGLQDQLLQAPIKRAAAALPAGSEIERVRFPDEGGASLEIVARGPNGASVVVVLDRRSGAAVTAWSATMYERLREFHNLLFLDAAWGANAGRYAAGVVGLLTVVMSASGLVLWARGATARQTAFRINFGASWKRTNWDLHRVGGAVSAGLILIVSASGAFLAFSQPAFQGPTTPPAPLPSSPTPAGDPALSLDELAERARRALPGARLKELRLATPEGGVVALFEERDARGEIVANPWVRLDRRDGATLAVSDRSAQIEKLSAFLTSIHRGQVLGGTGQALVFMTGLAPLLLGVSGLLIWWSKGKKSRRAAADRFPLAPAKRAIETGGPAE